MDRKGGTGSTSFHIKVIDAITSKEEVWAAIRADTSVEEGTGHVG